MLLALWVGQVGSGQMPMPMDPQGGPAADDLSPQQREKEIAVLIALNRMGLSPAQLERMQQILAELQTVQPQEVHRQHRQELREFLLRWQGDPEAFEEALQNFQEDRKARLQQVKDRQQKLLEELLDLLSYRQGEILRQALHRLSRPQAMEMGMMGMEMGMGRGMMGREGRPEHPMGNPPTDSPVGQAGMGDPCGDGPSASPGMEHGGRGRAPSDVDGMAMARSPMMQMMQHMRRMGMMGMMGGGMMGPPSEMPRQAPSLEELILRNAQLLEQVIAQKLGALQR